MVAKIEAEKIRQKRTDKKRKRMLRKMKYPLMFLLAFLTQGGSRNGPTPEQDRPGKSLRFRIHRSKTSCCCNLFHFTALWSFTSCNAGLV